MTTPKKKAGKKRPRPRVPRLTDKQRAFIEVYFGEAKMVAAEAGRIVGYNVDYAREILTKPHVQLAIERKHEQLAAKESVGTRAVLLELARCSLYDVKDFVTPAGNMKEIHDIPLDARRAIVGLKITRRLIGAGENRVEEIVTDLKLSNKTAGLDLIGKYYKMWNKEEPKTQSVPAITFYMDGKKI